MVIGMTDNTIGVVARDAGVGVETVRFYERRGLIQQPPKPQCGGFRLYPPETVHTIRFIRQAQELGFSLREIEDLLSLRAEPGSDCGDVRRRATAKLAEVEQKVAQLRSIRSALKQVIVACPGSGALDGCSILEAMSAAPAKPTDGTPRRS